jgi:hypothetical protein
VGGSLGDAIVGQHPTEISPPPPPPLGSLPGSLPPPQPLPPPGRDGPGGRGPGR